MVVVIPEDWNLEIDRILRGGVTKSTIVVLGAKGNGKSTFVRVLSDFCLKYDEGSYRRVAILDTDCGQPEKTAPGVMSLFVKEVDLKGVTINRMVSQRFVGFVNPAVNPFLYTQIVGELFGDFSRSESLAGVPLIVNCHGWGSGCGRETWEAVISTVRPDLIVQLGSLDGGVNLDCQNSFLDAADTPMKSSLPELRVLSKVISVNDESGSSSDKRWVKFATHFRPDLARKESFKASHPQEFFVWPYSKFVSLAVAKICFSFPCLDAPSSILSEQLGAVEKSIVGLCHSESGQCICLGFVDSVSLDKIGVFVPPSISHELVAIIDLVVKGDVHWSPRERVSHRGKTSIVDTPFEEEEAFYLQNVLGGSAARLPSSRTNLKRSRLD